MHRARHRPQLPQLLQNQAQRNADDASSAGLASSVGPSVNTSQGGFGTLGSSSSGAAKAPASSAKAPVSNASGQKSGATSLPVPLSVVDSAAASSPPGSGESAATVDDAAISLASSGTCMSTSAKALLARSARNLSAASMVAKVPSGQGAGKSRCTKCRMASNVPPNTPREPSTMALPRPTRINSEPFSCTKLRKRLMCRTEGTAAFRASERMSRTISGRCARLCRMPLSLARTCSKVSSVMGVLRMVISSLARRPASE
mmetsp:Transcript_56227/g.131020  ORF Transcript_56227/g.131020 Transcript_56227/m.131020 type:complete len:259 (-) Transcript_56227:480-1256(-)